MFFFMQIMTKLEIEQDNFHRDNMPLKESLQKEDDITSRIKYSKDILDLILKIMSIILCLINILFLVFLIYLLKNLILTNSNEDNEFDFLTASDFENIEYYGKSNLFNQIIGIICKIIKYTETKTKQELSVLFSPTSRNFLFYGPPGTGKTQFVKKLLHLLNKEFLEEENDETNYVRAYFITPSMIEDKFVGETEKRIKILFDEARYDLGWKATIIFLDEIDAFFSDRSFSQNDYSRKSKTEFLNLLSGINENITKNVFLIGSTNLKDNIDIAFLRRMGHEIEFKIPSEPEVYLILEEFTERWYKESGYDEKLKTVSKILSSRQTSQALIIDICKSILFSYDKSNRNLFSKLEEIVQNAEMKFSLVEKKTLNKQQHLLTDRNTTDNIAKFKLSDFLIEN